MKARRLRFGWVAIALVLGGILVVAGLTRWMEIRRAHSDFKWFGTLGFPDVKELPHVRVATGWWSQSGSNPPVMDYWNGFLLKSNATCFTVFTPDLSTWTFTNSANSVPEKKRVGFEIVDLRRGAQIRLDHLRKPSEEDRWKYYSRRASEQTEVFVLAWACWRQGFESQALDLYWEAGKLPRPFEWQLGKMTWRQKLSMYAERLKSRFGKGTSPKAPLRESLEKNIGDVVMAHAVEDFSNPSLSRFDLLREFEAILRNYPHSVQRERAGKTVEVLKRMIAEDRARATERPRDFVRLAPGEQIEELIFQLRDQFGYRYGVFDDYGDRTNTPPHQLARLGYSAVPQLIATLDSDTLSRVVEGGGFTSGPFDPSYIAPVLTVGDCAGDILERITGRSFFAARDAARSSATNGGSSLRRKAADAWWAEFQKKGERQMLVEGVLRADYDVQAQAILLRKHFPDGAASVLIQGIEGTTNSRACVELIEQLDEIGDATGDVFLHEEMIKGPTTEARVAAAHGVRKRDKKAAVSAMIREWEMLRATTSVHDDDDPTPLIHFLAGSDSLEAVSALTSNLVHRTVDIRYTVIGAFGDSYEMYDRDGPGSFSPVVVAAEEKCLVTELEDTERYTGMSLTRNDKSVSEPRICDMAAWYLSERWPARYSFDISKSLESRERQRIECINSWRKAHDLALLPVPQAK